LSYVEKHLIPGESVQYQTKLHWIVMLGHIAIAAFLALLGMAFLIARLTAAKAPPPSNVMYLVALFCLMLGAVIFCVGLLQRNATEMAVTNKRVIAKRGLVNRRTIEILLSRIESVAVEEPAFGRLLGYGTVIVRGTGGTPEMFEKIYRPLELREQVQQQIAGESKSR
jgi:uncharacterized membrane protein YdbT with pleckstrin-like domain